MTTSNQTLRIDADRLWRSLEEMAEIGGTEKGGCNRQALTDEDQRGRDLFRRWCDEAGLSVTVDSMGNMFARRNGEDPSLDPVAIGSHLDTQPTGGKYDGVLGVLAGLELVRTLNELGVRTRRPIEIVNWTNEEGVRFAPAMLSSGVFAGVYGEDWAKARVDGDGVPFGDALRQIDYEGAEHVGQRRFHAFLELHIEQGPILEDDGVDIGVVTHGQGLRWLHVEVTGRESHAGSTPMPRRRDALVGAARMIEAVEQIAHDYAEDAVGTVGRVHAAPNSPNVIPGLVQFSVDFRHKTQEGIDAMSARFAENAAAMASATGLELHVATTAEFQPVAFDAALTDIVRRSAETLGLSHRPMVSGAGHDACHVAKVAPTAMVFCPCKDGLSHNEAEAITPEWAEAGANVLLRSAIAVADMADADQSDQTS